MARQRAQEAHQLQQELQGLREEVQFFMKPTMNGLQTAALADLGDGVALMGALPKAINADNAHQAAQGQVLEELQAFASSINEVFNTMTAPLKDNQLLTGDMVRGRIKYTARALHAATRRETILEASDALRTMLPDYPDIDKALTGIEKAGEEAANKLDDSPLAARLRQAAQDSAPKR
jgi:hypothetical protein